jgi:LPS export ABC transporter protein LptC
MRLTGSRPVLVLGAAVAVALGCSRDVSAPVPPANVVSDSADQVMYGVKTTVHDNGLLRARLESDTVYMYRDNTLADLRVVTAEFFSAMGAKTATLTSKTGKYDVRLGSMEARGDAVVITEDGRTLESQHLKYDPQKNEFSSDSAFVLTEPDRTLRGIGFTSDPELSNIRVLKAASGEGVRVQTPPPAQQPQ